jgi:large subunit ribosomal protein L11
MKKVKAIVRLQIPAGQATPAPPVGPALAPHGINMKEFCDQIQSGNEKIKQVLPFQLELKFLKIKALN